MFLIFYRRVYRRPSSVVQGKKGERYLRKGNFFPGARASRQFSWIFEAQHSFKNDDVNEHLVFS